MSLSKCLKIGMKYLIKTRGDMMYIDDATERDNLLLARDPKTIKDPELLKRYWHLREMQEQDD